MRRMRAGWVLGLLALSSASAIGCGSADTANLFTGASISGGDAGSGAAANHAGSGNIVGTDTGGASMQSGGSSGSASAGAPNGGADRGMSGAGAGGSSGSAYGGSAGSAGSAGHAGTAGSAGHAGTAGTTGTAGSAGSGGAGAGAGGNGGTGGGTAGTGGTGGSNAGTGGMGGSGPASCTNNAGCNTTEYCAKADCADQTVGFCTAKPTDCTNVVAATICGCDGVTYHDACLLHLNRQNSLAVQPVGGACNKAAVGTLTCTALDSAACTAKNGVCSNKDDSCSGPIPVNVPGVCWVIPDTCPAADPKPVVTCGGENTCRSECTVLKAKVRYALSETCTAG